MNKEVVGQTHSGILCSSKKRQNYTAFWNKQLDEIIQLDKIGEYYIKQNKLEVKDKYKLICRMQTQNKTIDHTEKWKILNFVIQNQLPKRGYREGKEEENQTRRDIKIVADNCVHSGSGEWLLNSYINIKNVCTVVAY